MNNIIERIEEELKPIFKKIEETAYFNQVKVIKAFEESKIGLEHMYGSTGYGYSDIGKLKLNELFAKIFKAESAIVSPLITCGTHALNSALLGIVNSGDQILSITGDVYDSFQSAIYEKNVGSLADYNFKFYKIELDDNGNFKTEEILSAIKKLNPKIVYIQRSSGYANRNTFSISELEEIITKIKSVKKDVFVFVDNCYGTFSSAKEPTEVGADICVGSLIKNAGGGIAPTGGYIVGKECLINRVANRLFGIGLGTEVGSYAYGYQNFFQGVFLAPSVVKNAIKGSCLVGKVLEEKGIASSPSTSTVPNDIIRRIVFNDENKMINFIQSVQKCSAVDSFATPIPSDMPGYADKVIMAAGTFVQGASIEMSADGPLRPPYVAYFQGGITYEQVKYFAEQILENL